MQDLPFVQQHSYEWASMWHALGQQPINQGLPDPKAATSVLGESWQYMDTHRVPSGRGPEEGPAGIKHCFRHRHHPTTDQREYLHLPATRSYLHTTFTPNQPNPGLLVEWIAALRANFIPQVCGAYSNGQKGHCAMGLILRIAGLLTDDGRLPFDRIKQIAPHIAIHDIDPLACWLLDLQPSGPNADRFFYDLQERNDRRGALWASFPNLADHLLAQPFILERYHQLTQPAPSPEPDRDAAFTAWLQQVNNAFLARCGFTSEDLEDQCYGDFFDDDMPPEEVVDMVLEELGYANF